MTLLRPFLILFLTSCAQFLIAQSPPTVIGDILICDGSTTTLTASGDIGAEFHWYDLPTGGSPIFTGVNFTTPSLSSQTDYYAAQSVGTDTSARTQHTIAINPIPNPIQATNLIATADTICEGESAGLSATVDDTNHQGVYWYDAPTGGNLLGIVDSGELFTVAPQTTTTYYAESRLKVYDHLFEYTGAVQTFTVPDGIYELNIDAYGARGGGGINVSGTGNGGRVQATMQVVPGQVFNMYIGGAGSSATIHANGTRPGGWNGGGNGRNGGGGGGATDIRINGHELTDRVLVAGGGGGRGNSFCNGTRVVQIPHGGDLVGSRGSYCSNGSGELQRGRGGKQNEGGNPGCWHSNNYCAGMGGFGSGGHGVIFVSNSGAGGGGGWYGGGGAIEFCDGGGGSSYTDPALFSNVIHTKGVATLNGSILISYTVGISCANSTRNPITIQVDPATNLLSQELINSCPDFPLALTASGADNYEWLPNHFLGDTLHISPSASTTVGVIGFMNIGNCRDTVDIQIDIDLVDITSYPDTICAGSSINLSAAGANTYNWQPGSLMGANQTVIPSQTTTYIVEGMEAVGCSTFDSVEIAVAPNVLDMQTTPDTTISFNSMVSLYTSGANSYSWSTGDFTPFTNILINEIDTFYVTGIDSAGCIDTDTIIVSVDEVPEITGTTIIQAGTATTLFASEPPSNATGGSSSRNSRTSVNYAWYDAPTGGNLLSSTHSYTTPILDTNMVYFVEIQDTNGTNLRRCIKVNVIDAESVIAQTDQDSICPGDQANLTGSLESPGIINWYDASTGGNLLGSSEREELFTVNPSAPTDYYAFGEAVVQQDTFFFTGNAQSFTVPEGVTSLEVIASGAAGGSTDDETGANGGQVDASLNVQPGEVLQLYVGGAGGEQNGVGGWNGGGTGGTEGQQDFPDGNGGHAGGGGGASDIRIGGTSLLHRVLVAGGGGGATGYWCDHNSSGGSGEGGGLIAGSSVACVPGNSTPAGGGTQTGPGSEISCHSNQNCGTQATFGVGGAGNNYVRRNGGGGGAGWFGGNGGGVYGNGGGGSSYTHPDRCANVIHAQGVNNGNGMIILKYSLNVIADNYDSIRVNATDYNPPMPDIANLPDESDPNSVTLTPPTATDNCAGVITATTSDPLTYDTQGTYLHTWEYNDANGNTISQQQTVIIGNGLPIELLSFTGKKEKGKVILHWSTANEFNSHGFVVQHSEDAINWEDLNFVKSFGNSLITRNYSSIDIAPVIGLNYYRLMLIDQDGSIDFSNIIHIKFESFGGGIQVFPNPITTTADQFTVLITDENINISDGQLSVYNQSGRRVLSKPMNQNKMKLDVKGWTAGQYMIRVSSGSSIWQTRIVVLKN